MRGLSEEELQNRFNQGRCEICNKPDPVSVRAYGICRDCMGHQISKAHSRRTKFYRSQKPKGILVSGTDRNDAMRKAKNLQGQFNKFNQKLLISRARYFGDVVYLNKRLKQYDIPVVDTVKPVKVVELTLDKREMTYRAKLSNGKTYSLGLSPKIKVGDKVIEFFNVYGTSGNEFKAWGIRKAGKRDGAL